MIIYDWTITNMNHSTDDGFVTKVYWQCEASEEDYFTRKVGVCMWDTGEVTTPYENLTPEKVLEWCWKERYITPDIDNIILVKEAVESELFEIIEVQKTPVQKSGLPWE